MKLSIGVRIALAVLATVFTLNAQTANPAQAVTHASSEVLSRVTKLKGLKFVSNLSSLPPTSDYCLSHFNIPCYSPAQIRKAYGVSALINSGFTGSGETIVIIDSFGSPTIAQDLTAFDTAFNLPDPPSLTVLAPLGTVPFDPTDSAQVGWALETTLDVEWAHAMAPDANIVLLTSPVNETQGVQGLPEFLKLEQYALDHHLGHIISQSWGTAENTLFDRAGRHVLRDFQRFYERAARENVTVLASSGDSGTSNVDVNNNPFSFATVEFPASSPLVTAVGGTSLYADANGNYQSEVVWNNNGGATGGGVSQYFDEPLYQHLLPDAVRDTLNHHRGIPDVAYNADPNTAVLIYAGFFPDAADNGYFLLGGTSEGSPQWAGIVADANQLAGHPLGFLNPKLYLLNTLGQEHFLFHDITQGNNGLNGIPGYSATPGWDLSTGWGTPNLGKLAWELATR